MVRAVLPHSAALEKPHRALRALERTVLRVVLLVRSQTAQGVGHNGTPRFVASEFVVVNLRVRGQTSRGMESSQANVALVVENWLAFFRITLRGSRFRMLAAWRVPGWSFLPAAAGPIMLTVWGWGKFQRLSAWLYASVMVVWKLDN